MADWFEGPFTAPVEPPTATPAPDLGNRIPLLAKALSRPQGELPARRYQAWRSDEPWADNAYMAHWVEWRSSQTKALADLLAANQQVVSRLIELTDRWQYFWPTVAAKTLPAEFPAFCRQIAELAPSGPVESVSDFLDTALHVGLHEVVRDRYAWRDPQAMACPVCTRAFAPETLSHWMLRLGPPRYCPDCCCRVVNAIDMPISRQEAILSVSALCSSLGYPPASGLRRADLGSLELPQRDLVVAALIALPSEQRLARALGVTSASGRWLRVLYEAGVVGDAWRPARGTQSIASDGHLCRSLLERAVEEFMVAHGIPHDVEPYWPAHPSLNADGKRRADWLLADGTFVEMAGQMDDAQYAARMMSKQELAEASGIRLLVLTPQDLPSLRRLLAWHSSSR